MKKIQDLGVNDVVHCPTLEEAERILKMAHGLGLRWSDGASFLDRNYWSVKKDRTAYALLRGEYCNIESCQEMGYTIHRASEFFSVLPEKWAIKIDSQEVIDVVGAWLGKEKCGRRSTHLPNLTILSKNWNAIYKNHLLVAGNLLLPHLRLTSGTRR